MATELLDVLDTAVKIGLGGLISGVATYTVTNKNHNNEKGKEWRQKRCSLLESATESADYYFGSYIQFLPFVAGLIHEGVQKDRLERLFSGRGKNDTERQLWKVYEGLFDAQERLFDAITKLHLLDLGIIAESLESLNVEAINFRDKIAFHKNLPSQQEMDQIIVLFNKEKKEFYQSIHREYKNTYE